MQDRHGPMKTGRFEVQVDGGAVAGWTTVELPSRTSDVGEYREGDSDTTSRTVVGRTEYEDLEMERGVRPDDTTLWDWRQDVEQGRTDDARKTVTVAVNDDGGNPGMVWEFTNAWVKEYSPPELDASADGDVATESITVAFDEMKRTT